MSRGCVFNGEPNSDSLRKSRPYSKVKYRASQEVQCLLVTSENTLYLTSIANSANISAILPAHLNLCSIRVNEFKIVQTV
ncbi:hypothetical protein CHS0354_025896 [Potamilus streckersoni]|uniref:Uncharacterized protein n=1 Tax=Potamilus streckersoni TaxID=2493646 RepID=A0AAE0TK25_9BIVA|nr:hypothetical protein CHS0354_025896 [Potamilus streckersoni]